MVASPDEGSISQSSHEDTLSLVALLTTADAVSHLYSVSIRNARGGVRAEVEGRGARDALVETIKMRNGAIIPILNNVARCLRTVAIRRLKTSFILSRLCLIELKMF